MAPASWVIIDTLTGEPLVETWDKQKADWVNRFTKKYKAISIIDWLASITQRSRQVDIKVAAQETIKKLDNCNSLPKDHPYYGTVHTRHMLDQIISGVVTGEKAHRWLGWAQCAICIGGGATLPELKVINHKA